MSPSRAAGRPGSSHPPSAAIEDVRVDHGRADVAVAEQLLDRADVVTVLEQMGRERVPESVASGGLRDPRAQDGFPHRALQDRLVQVMPPPLPGLGVYVDARGGEHPLPSPLATGVRILAPECVRQRHPAGAGGEVALVLAAHRFDNAPERVVQDGGYHGATIAIAFAGAHHDLIPTEVDVLHPEGRRP